MTESTECNLHGHIWFYPEFDDTIMIGKRICYVCFRKEKKQEPKEIEWCLI